MEAYNLGIIGILALCLLSVLLAVYSCSSKGRAGALSGPIVPADDDNLLYRIDRVHMNSVEALAPFVVPAMLAMLVGVE
ncbi:MAG: MAPEG family protein, partial [Mesorhizobium sp.]